MSDKNSQDNARDNRSKSWFCVLNNPQDHGFDGEPQEICNNVLKVWTDALATNTGVVVYCISAEGLKHLHCVFEVGIGCGSIRFSAIKKLFHGTGMHFEPTKGSRQQVEMYLSKQGQFEEKGETIVCRAQKGEIQGAKDKDSILQQIESLIEQGMRPSQIMAIGIFYRQHETLIKKTFFAKRLAETPPIREVKVFWHVGVSGSGKSYTYVQLCEERGEDEIYMMSDMENGGLDSYEAQQILFIDEFKGQTPYYKLLQMLDKYKMQIHARYTNAYALWNEVHITSVYPPEEAYKFMVDSSERQIDSIKQLLRRIDAVIYHYKEQDLYRTYSQKMEDYTDYASLKQSAMGTDGFIALSEYETSEIPFT